MKSYLREDNTMLNTQRQQFGQKKSEDLPAANTVGKLRNDDPGTPKLKPYPLDRFDSISTDVFVQTMNLRKLLDTARHNPDVNRKHGKKIRYLDKQLEEISKTLVEISKIVDTIN